MKVMKFNLKILFIAGSLALSQSANAEVLFEDDFESGTFGKTVVSASTSTTARWGDRPSVAVVQTRPKTGRYSAQFRFANDADGDAWSELRFDLGKLNTAVWMQYDLYIPANYQHRPSGNNKFFRLWGADYGDQEKVGASTWDIDSGGGICRLNGDWNTGPGMGEHGAGNSPFIASADLGTWMTVKIYVKAATATANGTLNIWKNNTLIINNTNTMNNYTAGNSHAYRYGYLLGWANTGFNQTTDMYIDNVVIGTTEADLSGAEVVTPNPPVVSVQ
jgi:hypothetical protein